MGLTKKVAHSIQKRHSSHAARHVSQTVVQDAPIFKLPGEILNRIYEIVLARPMNLPVHAADPSVWPEAKSEYPSTLAIRLACRRFAKETFGYVFHTLELCALIGDLMSPRPCVDPRKTWKRFSAVIQDRWACITRLTFGCTKAFSWNDFKNLDWVLVPNYGDELTFTNKDVPPKGWEVVDWPQELREVSHINIYWAEGIPNVLFNRYLWYCIALLRRYFPKLDDVAFVYNVGGLGGITIKRCFRIEAGNIIDCRSKEVWRLMPKATSVRGSNPLAKARWIIVDEETREMGGHVPMWHSV
jgi:hypothetical protein